jgi:hypothetical protein
MHYCEQSEDDILVDILVREIPDIALVSDCCWRKICRVRGRYFRDVPDERWTEICRKRGYAFARENPRGF